jgi:hypothetical protein
MTNIEPNQLSLLIPAKLAILSEYCTMDRHNQSYSGVHSWPLNQVKIATIMKRQKISMDRKSGKTRGWTRFILVVIPKMR